MTQTNRVTSGLRAVAAGVERAVDAVRYRAKRRRGYTRPLAVQVYRALGNRGRVRFAARVLEDRGLPAPTPHDSAWVNLRRMLRMLETDEVPRARVRFLYAGQEQTLVADQEGYIHGEFHAAEGEAFPPGRSEIACDLLEPIASEQKETRFTGEVFIPHEAARWVVVSDIDDTVMHTQATSLVRMAVGTLFTNAYGRVAFPGVGAFYRSLHAADGRNPVFYLTSSPWNLYELIRTFLEIHGLPDGPLLMRDLGLGPGQHIRGGHEEHKVTRVRALLDLYPEQKFILIGDTGQHDAEIYLNICRQAPDRVMAVYLRDVSADVVRDDAVAGIVDEIRRLGVACVAAEDTVAHAEHAAEQGWITGEELHAVRGGRRKDEAEGAG